MLVLWAAVLADQQTNVRHLMISLVVLDFPAVLHLGEMSLLIASYAHYLSLVLPAQCINYLLSVESSSHNFGTEGVWCFQQNIFPQIFLLL